jgi:hypothetical protein
MFSYAEVLKFGSDKRTSVFRKPSDGKNMTSVFLYTLRERLLPDSSRGDKTDPGYFYPSPFHQCRSTGRSPDGFSATVGSEPCLRCLLNESARIVTATSGAAAQERRDGYNENRESDAP